MCNVDIRAAAKQAGVFLYTVADKLGVSEPTMTRLLRRELSEDKKRKILDIITEIASERQEISTK